MYHELCNVLVECGQIHVISYIILPLISANLSAFTFRFFICSSKCQSFVCIMRYMNHAIYCSWSKTTNKVFFLTTTTTAAAAAATTTTVYSGIIQMIECSAISFCTQTSEVNLGEVNLSAFVYKAVLQGFAWLVSIYIWDVSDIDCVCHRTIISLDREQWEIKHRLTCSIDVLYSRAIYTHPNYVFNAAISSQ